MILKLRVLIIFVLIFKDVENYGDENDQDYLDLLKSIENQNDAFSYSEFPAQKRSIKQSDSPADLERRAKLNFARAQNNAIRHLKRQKSLHRVKSTTSSSVQSSSTINIVIDPGSPIAQFYTGIEVTPKSKNTSAGKLNDSGGPATVSYPVQSQNTKFEVSRNTVGVQEVRINKEIKVKSTTKPKPDGRGFGKQSTKRPQLTEEQLLLKKQYDQVRKRQKAEHSEEHQLFRKQHDEISKQQRPQLTEDQLLLKKQYDQVRKQQREEHSKEHQLSRKQHDEISKQQRPQLTEEQLLLKKQYDQVRKRQKAEHAKEKDQLKKQYDQVPKQQRLQLTEEQLLLKKQYDQVRKRQKAEHAKEKDQLKKQFNQVQKQSTKRPELTEEQLLIRKQYQQVRKQQAEEKRKAQEHKKQDHQKQQILQHDEQRKISTTSPVKTTKPTNQPKMGRGMKNVVNITEKPIIVLPIPKPNIKTFKPLLGKESDDQNKNMERNDEILAYKNAYENLEYKENQGTSPEENSEEPSEIIGNKIFLTNIEYDEEYALASDEIHQFIESYDSQEENLNIIKEFWRRESPQLELPEFKFFNEPGDIIRTGKHVTRTADGRIQVVYFAEKKDGYTIKISYVDIL